MIRVTADRKAYVVRARIHHGLVGIGLIALGAGLCWHDRKDRWWLRDG